MTEHAARKSCLEIALISILCLAFADHAVAQANISSEPYGVISVNAMDSKGGPGKVASGKFQFQGFRKNLEGVDVADFKIEMTVLIEKDRHKAAAGFSIPVEKLQELAKTGALTHEAKQGFPLEGRSGEYKEHVTYKDGKLEMKQTYEEWGSNEKLLPQLLSRRETTIEVKTSAFLTEHFRLRIEEMKVIEVVSVPAANGQLQSSRIEGKVAAPFLTLETGGQ
jgi:hypothetical protein